MSDSTSIATARRVGRALDVVGGQLLAGEGVELAADAVDLGRDVARRGPALGALEEHVLGEVCDAGVGAARSESPRRGRRTRLPTARLHAGRQDAHAVGSVVISNIGPGSRSRHRPRPSDPSAGSPSRDRDTPPWFVRGVATDRSADRPPVLAGRVRFVRCGPHQGAPRRRRLERERLLRGGTGLRGTPARVDGHALHPFDRYGHDSLWWLDRLVRTNQPLVERMTLNLHDHFATSNEKVGDPALMIAQYRLMRRTRSATSASSRTAWSRTTPCSGGST